MIRVATLLLTCALLCGCSTHTSKWREPAVSRYSTALAAGSAGFAPEETDNIRQTIELAERYYKSNLIDEADRLFQLSCQKSQLLYRNLVLSKVRLGSSIAVQSVETQQPVEVEIAREPVSLQQIVASESDQLVAPTPAPEMLPHAVTPEVAATAVITALPVQSTQQSEQIVAETQAAPLADIKPIDVITVKSEPPEAPVIISSESPLPSEPVVTPIIAAPDRIQPPGLSAAIPVVSGHKPQASKIRPTREHVAATVPKPVPVSGKPTIYLTFDDGPSSLTLPIARFLNSRGIQATFFVLGNNIKGHEKAISETVSLGHQVGNHTLSHNLKKLNASLEHDSNEITKTAEMVERLGGDGKMVRVPYGAVTKTLRSKVALEGGQIFDWDINSNDSTRKGVNDPAFIERTVIGQLKKMEKKHVILLFHDGAGHSTTLTAIKDLVPRLQQEGYRFGLLHKSDRVARVSGVDVAK